eukprot:TRINITY_DN329_c1_g3_i1.p1 TRINITY_DN329_c1_g3~~TRINITY_DN329_c1_g3_i1.p1  ORF type:complete len:766 (-),score=154.04 TRINITY_DN329_c1_g3_i1:276-2525(-)
MLGRAAGGALGRWAVVVLVVLVGCLLLSGKANAENPAQGYVHTLSSIEEWGNITRNGGSVLETGRSTKFLVDLRAVGPRGTVYFVNSQAPGNSQRYHYYFAERYLPDFDMDLEEFNAAAYYKNKLFYVGTLQTYSVGQQSYLAIQFYPSDLVAEKQLADALRLLSGAIKMSGFVGMQLAFVATGEQQTVATIGPLLAQMDIVPLTLQDVVGGLTYAALVKGMTIGYLRMNPTAPTRRDIVVLDELPLELSVVAGVVTTRFQDSNSHIALKSAERGTPDAFFKSATNDPRFIALRDKPVKLVVHSDLLKLTAVTEQELKEYYAQQANSSEGPIIHMQYDANQRQMLSYDKMCGPRSDNQQSALYKQAAQCLNTTAAFGSKAANLAFLAHPLALGRVTDESVRPPPPSVVRGYNLTPLGFGVPFAIYVDFLAANPTLTARIKALQVILNNNTLAEALDANPALKAAKIAEIQALFYNGTFPPVHLKRIFQAAKDDLSSVVGRKKKLKLKFRSSASAEDIEGFNGAGLYNSYAAKIDLSGPPPDPATPTNCSLDVTADKMHPASIECAVKGVYASLYNERAIEERRFARIGGGIVMALAAVPGYDSESAIVANAVVVTKIQGAGAAPLAGYTFSVEADNQLVTNPPPGTHAEMTWANTPLPNDTTLTTVRFAKPYPDQPERTSRVLSDTVLFDVLQLVERIDIAHCNVKAGEPNWDCDSLPYVPDRKLSLDLELKFLENGHYLFKQVREFTG